MQAVLPLHCATGDDVDLPYFSSKGTCLVRRTLKYPGTGRRKMLSLFVDSVFIENSTFQQEQNASESKNANSPLKTAIRNVETEIGCDMVGNPASRLSIPGMCLRAILILPSGPYKWYRPRPVLGCIEADFQTGGLILQHFSGSTRSSPHHSRFCEFQNVCTVCNFQRNFVKVHDKMY